MNYYLGRRASSNNLAAFAYSLGAICLLVTPGSLWASSASDAQCASLSSVQDIVGCALQSHPDVKRAEAALSQGDELESQAKQIPNPELDSKATYGKQLGDTVINAEVSIAPIIELGGKRSARVQKARAEQEKTAIELQKVRNDVYISTLLALYRLRQVQSESRLVDEGLSTFSKIQRIFKSRVKLAPEQLVSLNVFQLAEGDYRSRKVLLSTENETIVRSVGVAIGQPFVTSSTVLPKRKSSWPDVSTLTAEGPLNGPRIKAVRADVKTAQAELELAKSAAWPDLKIGPDFELLTEGPFTYQTYGFVLSMPIPLFNVNGGGKAVAYKGLDRAQVDLQASYKELASERSVLVQKFKSATEALKSFDSLADIERKHEDMESLFQRGLVPSSLVIEAHRQILDFTKSQNELELSAMEALLKIYALDGNLLEEKFQ